MAIVNITATAAALSSTSGNALRDPLATAIVAAIATVTGNALRDPLVSATVAAVTATTAAGTKIHFVTAAVAAVTSTSGTMVRGSPVTDATTLSDMRNNLSKDYAQLSDIDLSGIANWEPIGTLVAPFTGTLDGNGYAIQNLTISRGSTDYVGLFGACSFSVAEARLTNVVITGANVTGRDYTGILAGRVVTDKFVDPTGFDLLTGCSSTGTVTGRTNVGGLIGHAEGPAFAGHVGQPSGAIVFEYLLARINTCYSAAVVTGTGVNIGGLIGQTSEIRPYRSRATGTVNGGDVVGGLVGRFYRSALEYCYATGAVTGDKTAGGLIGQGVGRPQVTRSYAEGDVTGIGVFAEPINFTGCGIGGLIGDTELEGIDYCYALGNVTGRYRVGGLVGSCFGGDSRSPNAIACFAHGNVSAVKAAGGIFGYVYAKYGQFTRLYCTGSVAGINRGAIIGEVGRPPQEFFPGARPGTPTFQDPAFFNSEASDAPTTNGGIGKTVGQMGSESTYDSDWTFFDNAWIIDIEESDFPILLWAYDPVGISLAVLNTGHGLLLAYTQEGATKYRAFDGTDWAATVAVPELPTPAETLNLCPTQDDRAVFVVDVDGILRYAVTGTDTLAIQHTGELLPGAFGNLIHLADDRLKLYLVNAVQALSEAETVLADWDDVLFEGVTPLPSDSFISRLRAKLIGDRTYAVWRSRGQHRAMVKDEVEVVPETDDVPAGSILLRQDTPVVRVSMELDSFERVSPLYTVTFTVTDSATTDPIEGATVTQGTDTATTNASGIATLQLTPGVYAYTVTATGYEEASGTVNVADADVVVAVGMQTVTVVVEETITAHDNTSSAYTIIGNRVEFKQTAKVTKVKFRSNSNAGTYTLAVRDNSENLIETVTATTSASGEWITFTLATPLNVTNGNRYNFRITRSGSNISGYWISSAYNGTYWKCVNAWFGATSYTGYTVLMGFVLEV